MDRLQIYVTLVILGGDAEVDEDGFAVQSDHDVVRLDVLVHDADYFVAVVHCLQHVYEVVASLPGWDAFFVLIVRRVVPADDVTEASFCVILGDEVDIAVRIVDDLVKP